MELTTSIEILTINKILIVIFLMINRMINGKFVHP